MDSSESKARSWRVIVALLAALLLGAVTTAQAAHNCAIASPLSGPTVQTSSAAGQAKDVHCLLCASSHVQALPSARLLIHPEQPAGSKTFAAPVSRNSAATVFSLYIRPPPAN